MKVVYYKCSIGKTLTYSSCICCRKVCTHCLIPTMSAISFLAVFFWSKAKICDLCSKINWWYICNTELVNLWETSVSFFICIAGCFFFLSERCRQPLATHRERLHLSERDTLLFHFVLELAPSNICNLVLFLVAVIFNIWHKTHIIRHLQGKFTWQIWQQLPNFLRKGSTAPCG